MMDDLMSHPYVSLGAIALGIAAVCAIFSILRGVFRLILHTSILTCSIWVAYRVWMITPDWGSQLFRPAPLWLPYVIPSLAGIFTLLVLRRIFRFLAAPLRFLSAKPESPPGKWFSASLSLVPTTLLCLIAALLIRHLGTLRQVEDPDTRSISVLWKDVIDRHIPPAWLQRIDPITDPLRLALAQWISYASQHEAPPSLFLPEPLQLNASWIKNPKWRTLLEQKRYGEILRDPQMEQALRDPQVQKVLEKWHQQWQP
jgi:hypothetical protein